MKLKFYSQFFFLCVGLAFASTCFSQTDSAIWANTTKSPTGFPTTFFDSAGYAFNSTVITANPYTFAKLGIYKTIKPASATNHPFIDTLQSLRQFAPTDTGALPNPAASAGAWEGRDTIGLPGRFIEFSITANQTFTVTKIVAPIFSGGGSTGTGSFYYSTDSINYTLLLGGKQAATPLKNDFSWNFINVPNVVINAGQKFYVRFLPFQNTTKTSTTKGIGFERFAIYGSTGTLSTSFKSIFATCNSGLVSLNWQVTDQVNTVNYVIEKSNSGDNNFVSIGNVTTTELNNYNFKDNNPYKGLNYYRIKALDKDGTFKYSNIVSVNYTDKTRKTSLEVYPNPVAGHLIHLRLANSTNELYQMSLYSTDGKLMYASSVLANDGNSDLEKSIPANIKAGHYLLRLSNSRSTLNQSILIQ